MADKQTFLTKEWYEKLLHELHVLEKETLPEIVEQIKDAKAEGDLSENSEYHDAKDKQALTKKRISEIQQMLKDVSIIEEGKKKGKTVRYGSTVHVRMLESEKEYTFRMVGSAEVALGDSMQISFESPIGKAIEWKKEGDKVFVRLAEGKQKLHIVSVA